MYHYIRLCIFCFVTSILGFSCKTVASITPTLVDVEQDKKPKNIILMIGDGMGLSAISAANYTQKKPLNMLQCPVMGFQKTYSHEDLITDSAAAATAMACGQKTYNTAIGVLPDSTPCRTILELAESANLATGLVVTSSLTHATPAAFAAHEPLRALDEPIAADLAKSGIDIMIGGGKKFFNQRDMDSRNLLTEMINDNYYVSDYEESIGHLKVNDPRRIAYFSHDNQPPSVQDGRFYLPKASLFATQYLAARNAKGFFMMIEGSQIDWAAHANKYPWLIAETLDFDDAVGQVLNFAAANGETLVIITADHETGGLALNPGSQLGDINPAFTTKQHTATLVPVFAYGPGAHLFNGIYDNTTIFDKMKFLLSL